jgi:hypothetical protein
LFSTYHLSFPTKVVIKCSHVKSTLKWVGISRTRRNSGWMTPGWPGWANVWVYCLLWTVNNYIFTQVANIFWHCAYFFPRLSLCINFDKKCFGQRFGQFFQKTHLVTLNATQALCQFSCFGENVLILKKLDFGGQTPFKHFFFPNLFLKSIFAPSEFLKS